MKTFLLLTVIKFLILNSQGQKIKTRFDINNNGYNGFNDIALNHLSSDSLNKFSAIKTSLEDSFIRCNYSNQWVENEVVCDMAIFNPNGRDDFTEIEGTLPQNTSYDNVVGVTIAFQLTTNVPSIICQRFPSLIGLIAVVSSINTINNETFRNCNNLQWLGLSYNNISTIPDLTFGSNLRNLRSIDFGANQLRILSSRSFAHEALSNIDGLYADLNYIDEIDPNWFDSAIRLVGLDLNRNQCAEQNFQNVHLNRQQVRNALSYCFENYLRPQTTTTVSPDITFIRCEYIRLNTDEYLCEMTVNNPEGRNDFTQIEGNLPSEVNYNQVTQVSVKNQLTLNVPSIICQQFPRLQMLKIQFSQLNILNHESFEACHNISEIILSHNNIGEIGNKTFGNHIRNLELIDLAFNHLSRLSFGSFGTESIRNIITFNADFNSIDHIDSNWFDSATNLHRLDLRWNICINVLVTNLQLFRSQIKELLMECFDNYEAPQFIRCSYTTDWMSNVYCEMSIRNTENKNDFTAIEGLLPPGTSYNQVVRVIINMQWTTNIPTIICRQFSQLRVLDVWASRLTTINHESFEYCNNIEWIALPRNQITTIPANTFGSNLRSLRIIDFDNNLIQEISLRSFAPEILANISSFYAENNQVNAIDSNWFDLTLNLELLHLFNNSCTNENFGNVRENRQQVRNSLATCFSNYEVPQTTTLPTITTTVLPINSYIRCTYQFLTSVDLACIMSINNPEGRDDFDRIEGNFPPIANPNQLTYVWMTDQHTTNIPTILCLQFPQILFLDISRSRLTTINQNSFANCNNLQYILLPFNNISIIPDNTFGNNLRNIYSIDLRDNQIQRLSSRSFSSEVLNKINHFQADSNFINAIDANWFDSANNITRLYLSNNLCVDMNFINVHLNRELVRNTLNVCFNNYNVTLN